MPPADYAIRIAVIIPCHNHGRYLGECIESVLCQSLPPTEVVVVDDGSTDETPQVCSKYREVRYLRKQNGGAASARNMGLRYTTAEFVLFLDADDFLLAGCLENLARGFHEAGDLCGAVFARASRFRAGDSGGYEVIDQIPSLEVVQPFISRQVGANSGALSRDISYRLLKSSVVPQCSALVRRSVYDQVGCWDETLTSVEDREMWVRIAAHVDMAFSSETVAMIRRHDGNQSQGKHWIKNHQNIVRLLMKIWRTTTFSDKMRRRARRQLASTAHRLAGRLITTGDYDGAYSVMRISLAARPVNPRSWARFARCFLGRWLSRHTVTS